MKPKFTTCKRCGKTIRKNRNTQYCKPCIKARANERKRERRNVVVDRCYPPRPQKLGNTYMGADGVEYSDLRRDGE